jgi:hypothetical protein
MLLLNDGLSYDFFLADYSHPIADLQHHLLVICPCRVDLFEYLPVNASHSALFHGTIFFGRLAHHLLEYPRKIIRVAIAALDGD